MARGCVPPPGPARGRPTVGDFARSDGAPQTPQYFGVDDPRPAGRCAASIPPYSNERTARRTPRTYTRYWWRNGRAAAAATGPASSARDRPSGVFGPRSARHRCSARQKLRRRMGQTGTSRGVPAEVERAPRKLGAPTRFPLIGSSRLASQRSLGDERTARCSRPCAKARPTTAALRPHPTAARLLSVARPSRPPPTGVRDFGKHRNDVDRRWVTLHRQRVDQSRADRVVGLSRRVVRRGQGGPGSGGCSRRHPRFACG